MAVREVVIPVHSDVREVQRLVQQQLPVHIGEAGVAVPARLHDSQRQATIDAGAFLGLVDLEEEVIASAAAAAAVGSFRATRSRSLAAAAAEHCWALYRQPRIVELYRLDADDQVCGSVLQRAAVAVPTETGLTEGAFFGEDLLRPPEALPELLPEPPALRGSGTGGTNEGKEGLGSFGIIMNSKESLMITEDNY